MPKLKLVTLPIGNDLDITQRARECLESSDHIFVEDTRVFKNKIERMGIELSSHLKLDSFHDHSDNSKMNQILELLTAGNEITFCSDAGSPVISDPAYPLIQKALGMDVELESYGGVSAPIYALELSGLPPHPFTFHGFLPRESGKIASLFESCIEQGNTHIFFESPHRIKKTLMLFSNFKDEVEICVARELTKTHQSIYRFSSNAIDENLEQIVEKGEFVLLFYAKGSKANTANSQTQRLVNQYLEGKRSTKHLAKIFASITGDEIQATYERLSHSK